ncbi:MAG: glutamate--tRNA ligase [Candidatus Nitronauta litoralis]|uniref:Glutamate--tRNA ligase n=1 Tax=Candidatus Nitronauta litoralis TaxID=2705533 RepID=A0A7T0FZ12_9BACT|nr:MAG: glutamate--tRNA ligase [Candidatus Nitronauta litoralis]
MNDKVRVRFAPSPTGYLHIGGVRTALFNWLYARNQGGTFVLRIEDTDASRSTDESIQEILAAMAWLGLDHDEGPYRQTERQDLYNRKIQTLLDNGQAYRCYCSAERVEELRKQLQAEGKNPMYDGLCRNREDQPDEPHVIRLKSPLKGNTVFNDLLRGNISWDNTELDDFILQRTDGTPTYNFVVVVDDADMNITHVIRGDDHLSNTPKQILIFDALGLPRPKFAHISMILGNDKKRLSKRHGATSTLAYRDDGFLPDALVNYLARLGWSHGDQELFSRDELIQHFSMDSITTSAAVFNPEKLLWVNEQTIQATPDSNLATLIEPFLVKGGILEEGHSFPKDDIIRAMPALKTRGKTLIEVAQAGTFYFKETIEYEEKAVTKFLKPEAKPLLESVITGIETMAEPLQSDALEILLKKIAEDAGLKFGKLAQPMRVALTGGTASPGIYDVVLLLGKDRSLARLKHAVGLC